MTSSVVSARAQLCLPVLGLSRGPELMQWNGIYGIYWFIDCGRLIQQRLWRKPQQEGRWTFQQEWGEAGKKLRLPSSVSFYMSCHQKMWLLIPQMIQPMKSLESVSSCLDVSWFQVLTIRISQHTFIHWLISSGRSTSSELAGL